MQQTLLEVDNLKRHFVTKRGIVKAVDGISFTIKKGETLGLVGESGSGKSTVAYTIIGMYQPTSGKILFNGQEIRKKCEKRPRELKKEIQIVFQDPGSSLNPRRSIRQILEVPLSIHRRSSDQSRREQVVSLLEMVELPLNFITQYPQAIGGGEKQMVAIARALATNPSLVLLDEPTSALDVSVQAKIIGLLVHLQKQLGLTYLFITHDLSLMQNMSDRVAIMYLGKLSEITSTSEFLDNPCHPYTRMLLSAIPVVSEEEAALKPKKIVSHGEIPSPVNIPPGCSFHPRCPERMEECSVRDPVMVDIDQQGHRVRCHLWNGDG